MTPASRTAPDTKSRVWAGVTVTVNWSGELVVQPGFPDWRKINGYG